MKGLIEDAVIIITVIIVYAALRSVNYITPMPEVYLSLETRECVYVVDPDNFRHPCTDGVLKKPHFIHWIKK